LKIISFILFCPALKVGAAPSVYVNNVDAGELREDILDINLASQRHLFEGDIAIDPGRNALRNETTRWKFPIPYILTDSLDLNAKGVILQAFEMYRLKSCVDFKPYEGEQTFLSFQKLDGCWSYVGDFHEGQNVSIGERCDTKAIVEHEVLHALGFYHEQSRTDRDDYVKIWWDEIIPGREHNFVKYDDEFITDLNTPYDYESIMHYRPLSFNKNESVPTITTVIPAFNDIIGQRLDFSTLDLVRLNRMYNCTSSITLLDQCSFELNNICGMIQNEEDSANWGHTLSVPGIEDHTLLGRCRDAGYFMHFDASNGQVGRSALLESRILYPKRNQQCLEFFYKIKGDPKDLLVIWIKMDDGSGNLRKLVKVKTIKGDGQDSWKIAHVNLNVRSKFRYIFQGIVGSQNTTGGIFVDDVTLTETKCPGAVWQIQNFTSLLQTPGTAYVKESPIFYSPEGYRFGITLHSHGPMNSTYVNYTRVYFHLFSGENDEALEWPAQNRQVTIIAMDQDPDVRLRMSVSRSFTTNTESVWNKPSINGEWDPVCNCFKGHEFGWNTFVSHQQLFRRSFLKNNDLILLIDFEDLTHLVKTGVPVKPRNPSGNRNPMEDALNSVNIPKPRQVRSAPTELCHPNFCLNGGVCMTRNGKPTCRCALGQMSVFFGERCEKQQVNGHAVGVMIGGATGTLALMITIIAIILKRR
uniref:Meprin A subunit n=2 Tax=Lepisosteus oculatus TaxID=7918 RepID=W5NIB3_LEPOC